jgi:hypothetical protein
MFVNTLIVKNRLAIVLHWPDIDAFTLENALTSAVLKIAEKGKSRDIPSNLLENN